MKAQFNQMLEEQIMKIRSYETRVNKAKQNYTKALKRLEELNNKIYEQRLSPTDGYVHNDDDDDDRIDQTKPDTESINIDGQNYPINQMNHDETIFDNKILDQLILEDDIDENFDRLKIECFNNQHKQQQIAQKTKENKPEETSLK